MRMKMENLPVHRADGKEMTGERGFTLIEVLIAVFILTVGLMAMGAVQMVSMRSGGDSFMRTQAAIAAADMADRMRANITGVNAGNYAAVAGPLVNPGFDCIAATCTAAQIAQLDAFQWLNSLTSSRGLAPLSRGLAGATGTVACPAAGGICTITVMWDGRHNGAAGQGCNPANPADLICYQVGFRP